jgi:hypothetical protein
MQSTCNEFRQRCLNLTFGLQIANELQEMSGRDHGRKRGQR